MQKIIFIKGTHTETHVRKDGVVQKYHVGNTSAGALAKPFLFKAPEVRNAAGKLLAPNGQVSKLTKGQWHQVRSPQFKAWFGDWESASVLNGPALMKLESSDAPSGSFKAVEDWAAQVFAEQGGKAYRKGIGNVLLDHRAAHSSMAHGGANKYKKVAFAAVKDVIERGALVWQGTDGREDSYYFSAPVDIDDVTNIETVLVHRDFNTGRMYLHSVTTKENLLNQRVSSVDAGASERSGSIDSKGVVIVLQNLLNGNGVSKVVDPQTGEPVVGYHGTASDFRKFDATKQGQSFDAYEGAFPRDGFWFTDSQSNADWYSHVAANGLEGEKPGGGRLTMPVFLSLKNPYYYTAEMFLEHGEEGVPTEGSPDLEGHDGVIVTVAEDDDAPTPDAEAMWSTYTPVYGAPITWPADLWAKYESLLAVPPTVKHTHYVAFNAEDIKSAIGNNGAFSPTDIVTKSQPAMPRIILFRTSKQC